MYFCKDYGVLYFVGLSCNEMKILGLTYYRGFEQVYVKPDSALLVNEKPFFLPDFAAHFQMKPCLVARVNRLGRCVEERFAHRYYDEVMVGLNVIVGSQESGAKSQDIGTRSDIEWIGFDNSLVVGDVVDMVPCTACGINDVACLMRNEERVCELRMEDLIVSLDAAIERLTRFVTIRMGDMIAVDFDREWIDLVPEDKWHIIWNEQKVLSCKIK